jgi:hypothetical protein
VSERTAVYRLYDANAAYWLSDDGMTLIVTRRTPAGIATATYERRHDAGPFTDADVDSALSAQPAATRTMQPGQRNKTRRFVTRFGTLWLHVMTGPPTWWWPRLAREKDGALMAGWLRRGAAVKFDRR